MKTLKLENSELKDLYDVVVETYKASPINKETERKYGTLMEKLYIGMHPGTSGGSQELIVTAKEVCDVMVAAIKMTKKHARPQNPVDVVLAVIFTIFKDYLADITAYIDEMEAYRDLGDLMKGMNNN